MRRLVHLVTHNWPLKLAALVLATLLYAGLVVSQSAQELNGSVPIEALNQPATAVLCRFDSEAEGVRLLAVAVFALAHRADDRGPFASLGHGVEEVDGPRDPDRAADGR